MDELSANLLAPFPSAQVFNLSPQSEFMARKDEPAWLADYRGSHGVEPLQNANWVALGARSDAPPLRVLSYDPASPAEFHMLYRASPFAQAAQFDFARELVVRERLGQTDGFDVLLLSLGSTALLGYETGAFSPLMSQMVLHLDRQIESLLNLLDKQLGTGNFTFVFAGAHGAPPAREGAAVSGEAVARGIDRSLSARYDMSSIKNTYVDRYVYPFLYLKTEQLRRYDIPLREARRTAGELAMELPGVAAYYTADDDCSHQGPWRRWFRNSFHAARSGDVMLGYLPGCVEDYAGGRGVSYGSMYTYDTRVPLILYGPQFRSQVFENTVELVDVAPTLSRSCGVAVPSSSIGRVLADTFESRTGR
jgi:hypothetical protein